MSKAVEVWCGECWGLGAEWPRGFGAGLDGVGRSDVLLLRLFVSVLSLTESSGVMVMATPSAGCCTVGKGVNCFLGTGGVLAPAPAETDVVLEGGVLPPPTRAETGPGRGCRATTGALTLRGVFFGPLRLLLFGVLIGGLAVGMTIEPAEGATGAIRMGCDRGLVKFPSEGLPELVVELGVVVVLLLLFRGVVALAPGAGLATLPLD